MPNTQNTITALIYQPAKTAMQSGKAKTKQWVLELPQASPRTPEPLMGWVASADTANQVQLKFASAEAAVSFATQKGWAYSLQAPSQRVLVPRTYMDNFKYQPLALPNTQKADK
jgi:hypothetical protein